MPRYGIILELSAADAEQAADYIFDNVSMEATVVIHSVTFISDEEDERDA